MTLPLPGLYNLSITILSLVLPFFILSIYRLLVIIICSCCGAPIQGVVVSIQRNSLSSCYYCHSTHKMMLHPNNTTNIELWIAFHRGKFNYNMTMVEMPFSSYDLYPRGKKVNLRFCRIFNGKCYRAETNFTCQRFCKTLIRDRVIDFVLLLLFTGGIAGIYSSIEQVQLNAAELIATTINMTLNETITLTVATATTTNTMLGIIAVPVVLSIVFVVCCCCFNCCFLRMNPYPQHIEESLKSMLLKKSVPKVPTLRQQMSAEVTDLTARDMCNREQEKVEDGTDVEREAVERKVVNVNRISIELTNVDSGSGTNTRRSNITTEGSDCSDDDLEMRTFER